MCTETTRRHLFISNPIKYARIWLRTSPYDWLRRPLARKEKYLEFIQWLVALFLHIVLHCTEIHWPFDNQRVTGSNEVRHRKRKEGTRVFPTEKTHTCNIYSALLRSEEEPSGNQHCEETDACATAHKQTVNMKKWSVLHLWSCLMSWFKASCRGVCSFSAGRKNRSSRQILGI